MNLEGRVAWVTGASRGIGRATAVMLAAHGARLVLGAREESNLRTTVDEIRALSASEPTCIAYDVADVSAVKTAAGRIHKELGALDVLVNNAGILDDALLGMVTPQQLERTLAVNTHAVVYHMQYASRLMARKNAGSIVNVSSIIGRVGNEGQVVYGASKAAVIGATLSAAKELAPQNIRVNVVAPGFIETDMVKTLPREKYEDRVNSIKMKRVGAPDDVARVILFLASDLASYVTGQVIGVDGGMLI